MEVLQNHVKASFPGKWVTVRSTGSFQDLTASAPKVDNAAAQGHSSPCPAPHQTLCCAVSMAAPWAMHNPTVRSWIASPGPQGPAAWMLHLPCFILFIHEMGHAAGSDDAYIKMVIWRL